MLAPLLALVLALLLASPVPASADNQEHAKSGKALYDFYCYQCHGYTGDGVTLAATYLDPKPRDFTNADPAVLDRSRMLDAVRHGRPGTAMVSFTDVIDQTGLERVVDFIRREIMHPSATRRRYHTPENGWPDHDRFAAAFPFASGTITLAANPAGLSATERRGRELYLGACVTCHDHGGSDNEPLRWDLKPLSYPRWHYSHKEGHLITGASPYAVHDRRPDHGELTPAQAAGQDLYEINCAFCHAMDGTGKNWIGRFLEPHARDLTSPTVSALGIDALEARIARGLPGTSMPAWSEVLSQEEMGSIATYLVEVLADSEDGAVPVNKRADTHTVLSWQRQGD